MMLYKHVEYNLPFAPKGKSLVVNKDTKSQKLLHSLLALVITMSTGPPRLASIVLLRLQSCS